MSKSKYPHVSIRVLMFSDFNFFKRLDMNSGYSVGSPPERVTPPFDISKKGLSFIMMLYISSIDMCRPSCESASDGQISTHSKHKSHFVLSMKKGFCLEIALFLQSSMQVLQAIHFCASKDISRLGLLPSGLWHHTQERGQPLKNITVLMPSPSSNELPFISKIRTFLYSVFRTFYQFFLQFMV